jgi:CBS domain-containing protein
MTNAKSEFEEAYEDEQEVRGAIFGQPIRALDPDEAVCVSPATPVGDAIAAMNQAHAGCVLVTEGTRLVGIFTERDVLKKVVGRLDLGEPVGAVMTRDPETVGMDDGIAYALSKMHVGGYRNIPVVDKEGRPAGMVSVRDFVEFIVARFPAGTVNVPPDPRLEARGLDGG